MIKRRRARLALLALVASTAASGCATFSDDGAVARVGDEELSSDGFSEQLAALDPTGAAVAGGRADGDAARAAVSGWIRTRILEGSDIGLRYAADPAELGITCLDVAVAQDLADAESLKARLDGGEAWDDVVAPIEASIGYESKQDCQPLSVYGAQLGEDVAERLGELKPGDDPAVVDAGNGGFAVIRIQELADLDSSTLLAAVQGLDPDAVQALIDSIGEADVYVDPRIGSFDAASVAVVPVN